LLEYTFSSLRAKNPYIGRMSLATFTHPVVFRAGVASVSPEDLAALRHLGVVRVLA